MAINISLPEFGSKNMNSKDAIISLLSRKFPLNAKEIFNEVKRSYESNVSYQAIHKTLQALEQEGVIEKAGSKYRLGQSWISNLNHFAKELQENYVGHGKYGFEEGFEGVLNFEFDDISVYARTMVEWFISGKLIGNGPSEPYGLFRHGLWTLKFDFSEFNLIVTLIKKHKAGYCVFQNDMPFDKWVAKQYLKAGFKGIKLGLGGTGNQDLFVHGDSIIQATYSPEAIKMLDELYPKVSNLQDLFKVYMAFKPKPEQMKVHVRIEKNPQLAEICRQKILSYFDKKGAEK